MISVFNLVSTIISSLSELWKDDQSCNKAELSFKSLHVPFTHLDQKSQSDSYWFNVSTVACGRKQATTQSTGSNQVH